MDYIDLSDLQKRGIIKKNEKVNSEEGSDYYKIDPTQTTQNDKISPLSFLDTFANSVSNSTTSPSNATSSSETQDVKIKLEDFEYKLDRLVDKLAIIESKLKEFEKKTE
jgi:hypothetical protein